MRIKPIPSWITTRMILVTCMTPMTTTHILMKQASLRRYAFSAMAVDVLPLTEAGYAAGQADAGSKGATTALTNNSTVNVMPAVAPTIMQSLAFSFSNYSKHCISLE